jgi:plastocyanin
MVHTKKTFLLSVLLFGLLTFLLITMDSKDTQAGKSRHTMGEKIAQVKWENRSMLVHTVTAVPEIAADQRDVALPKGAKPFNSSNIEPGQAFQHKFIVPGTYRYFCIPHEGAGMVGEIIVDK